MANARVKFKRFEQGAQLLIPVVQRELEAIEALSHERLPSGLQRTDAGAEADDAATPCVGQRGGDIGMVDDRLGGLVQLQHIDPAEQGEAAIDAADQRVPPVVDVGRASGVIPVLAHLGHDHEPVSDRGAQRPQEGAEAPLAGGIGGGRVEDADAARQRGSPEARCRGVARHVGPGDAPDAADRQEPEAELDAVRREGHCRRTAARYSPRPSA